MEAVIALTNENSLKVAKKIFLESGTPVMEGEANTRALWFKKRIDIE